MLSLTRKAGGLALECEKQKDDNQFESIPLVLQQIHGSCVIARGTALTNSRRVDRGTRYLEVLAVLKDVEGTDGVAWGDWQIACRAKGISVSTFDRHRKRPVLDGLAELDTGSRRYSSTKQPSSPGTP
jgi:hypothetical protein